MHDNGNERISRNDLYGSMLLTLGKFFVDAIDSNFLMIYREAPLSAKQGPCMSRPTALRKELWNIQNRIRTNIEKLDQFQPSPKPKLELLESPIGALT